MEKIWITGFFGYIGNYLGRYIVEKGHAVYGIGRTNRPVDDYWLDKTVVDNISTNSLDALLSLSGKCPDVVYHCAGTGSVGAAQLKPYDDFESTVSCLAILLEWVRVHSPATRIIITSSAAVYGEKYGGAIQESFGVSPVSVYGYNKTLVEGLCEAYRYNFDIDIIITRLFSVYGEGLCKQLLWDSCMKISNLQQGDSLKLFGTGKEKRDWIHISDVSETLYSLLTIQKNECNILNIGTGIANTVDNLIDGILFYWFGERNSVDIKYNGEIRKGDPLALVSDNTSRSYYMKAADVTMLAGVERYVTWFKDYNKCG